MVFDVLLGNWIDKSPGKRALESALPNDPRQVKPDALHEMEGETVFFFK